LHTQREREREREREDWGAERCHSQQDEKNMPNLTQYLQLLNWHSTFHHCISASPCGRTIDKPSLQNFVFDLRETIQARDKLKGKRSSVLFGVGILTVPVYCCEGVFLSFFCMKWNHAVVVMVKLVWFLLFPNPMK